MLHQLVGGPSVKVSSMPHGAWFGFLSVSRGSPKYCKCTNRNHGGTVSWIQSKVHYDIDGFPKLDTTFFVTPKGNLFPKATRCAAGQWFKRWTAHFI